MGSLPISIPRTALPIRLPVLWKMYLTARDAFWTPSDINLTVDKEHWAKRLGGGERQLVSRALGFFATADGLVTRNIASRLYQEVAYLEARFFYGFQIVMENIHAEMYAKLIDTLIPEQVDQEVLFRWSTEVPSIAFKHIWATKWTVDTSRSFAERLIAYVCVESVFFSASFAVLSWFKLQGKLPGMTRSIDFIVKDESLHVAFACALLRRLSTRPMAGTVRGIVKAAVKIETDFAIGDLLTRADSEISLDDMQSYIRYNADQLLVNMGYDVAYGDSNPFLFASGILPALLPEELEDEEYAET
ncbi:hypothetical protein D9611_010393 [Ephemerocybe angulata]|uniref:Uncharacterized protein n=1 Tax=Ephemerocybe angulata TaxID=980116 RepID=A0A8H5FAQ5_9AGAR|nr:hypothetical protein D9611_010393 [Tulosesus angulatus]